MSFFLFFPCFFLSRGCAPLFFNFRSLFVDQQPFMLFHFPISLFTRVLLMPRIYVGMLPLTSIISMLIVN